MSVIYNKLVVTCIVIVAYAKMYKPIMSNVIAYYDDNPKPSSLFERIFWFISVVSAAII